ncbi:MAG: sigma-E factor negative regulatory protein [Chromatiales bacterium]|nr:sigma-E factor negative regulatory protein [Chromatiales bacterium]
MTDEPRQRLSALQDDELAPAQLPALLDALAGDPELRERWERYTLIGQAMRGEAIDPAARALADRVRAALASEPTVLCPQRLERASRRWTGRHTGLALAASVLLVAVLATPIFVDDPVGPTLGPVAARLVERQSLPLHRWHLEHPALASKLDRYLVTHQATAPATGAKGLLPYAMLVGYEPGR